MKKYPLIASMMVIMVASIFAGAGTMAWYSDTETSIGNVFTADTLDLKILVGGKWYGDNAIESAPAFFTVTDAKPGDRGSAVVGLQVDQDAWAKIWEIPTSNAENDRNERELEAGDTRTGKWGGELDEYLYATMWLDYNHDGVHDPGEPYLYGDYDVGTGKYIPVADGRIADMFPDLEEGWPPDFDPKEFCIVPGYLEGGKKTYIGISWRVGKDAGNEIQGDSISFDVMFEVKQYENFEDAPFKFHGES